MDLNSMLVLCYCNKKFVIISLGEKILMWFMVVEVLLWEVGIIVYIVVVKYIIIFYFLDGCKWRIWIVLYNFF